ncbi:hypothetical protein B0H13DRAFT_2431632 [Mycena leptocephala]|nr:hypothetical protein B0H13DRAFT_2431632 [Mycena leptocephala]
MQQSDPTLLTFLRDVRHPNTLPTQGHLGNICTEVLSIHRTAGHWIGRTRVGSNPVGTWSESSPPRKTPRCPVVEGRLEVCYEDEDVHDDVMDNDIDEGRRLRNLTVAIDQVVETPSGDFAAARAVLERMLAGRTRGRDEGSTSTIHTDSSPDLFFHEIGELEMMAEDKRKTVASARAAQLEAFMSADTWIYSQKPMNIQYNITINGRIAFQEKSSRKFNRYQGAKANVAVSGQYIPENVIGERLCLDNTGNHHDANSGELLHGLPAVHYRINKQLFSMDASMIEISKGQRKNNSADIQHSERLARGRAW